MKTFKSTKKPSPDQEVREVPVLISSPSQASKHRDRATRPSRTPTISLARKAPGGKAMAEGKRTSRRSPYQRRKTGPRRVQQRGLLVPPLLSGPVGVASMCVSPVCLPVCLSVCLPVCQCV